ncbi:MAG: hypothetical protein V2I97_13935, partial [Desulfococcaceae bacterium]|nr:hypothetical protein [Desulfococcaceae bacterium]
MWWLFIFAIIGLILFVRHRAKIKRYRAISELALLHLEIERQRKSGDADGKDCDIYNRIIDFGLIRIFTSAGLEPGSPAWMEQKKKAWHNWGYILQKYSLQTPPPFPGTGKPASPAPVVKTPPPLPKTGKTTPPPVTAKKELNVILKEQAAVSKEKTGVQASRMSTEQKPAQKPAAPTVSKSETVQTSAVSRPVPKSVPKAEIRPALKAENKITVEKKESVPADKTEIKKTVSRKETLKIKKEKSGMLEQLMQKVSGWSRLLIPFLLQNIGWFISCFSFVTGSVFLITYSEGFLRSLMVCLTLFAYTLLTLFGAYQLRKRRPELRTAGNVLTTLGMLLIPLGIASGIPLIRESFIIGTLITLSGFVIFGWAAQLASGTMDRSLQKAHPGLFMSLTALQMAVPFYSLFPRLPVMSFFHMLT